jgi:hypothetical protein
MFTGVFFIFGIIVIFTYFSFFLNRSEGHWYLMMGGKEENNGKGKGKEKGK